MPVTWGAGPSITMPFTPCSAPQPFVPSFKPRMTCKPSSTAFVPLDAAHSFGATYAGPVGRQADITGFSFHTVKNLTTAEGGALAFSLYDSFDMKAILGWFKAADLARAIKKRIGKTTGSWHYDVVDAGYKCNMTDVQAWPCTTRQIPGSAPAPGGNRPCVRQGSTAARGTKVRPRRCIAYKLVSPLSAAHQRHFSRAARPHHGQPQGARHAANVHFQPLPMLTLHRRQGEHGRLPRIGSALRGEFEPYIHLELTDDDVTRIIQAVKEEVETI